jgi:ATP synthase protein I
MRLMAARILLVQTGVTLCLAVLCFLVWGPRHGGSALAGGAIGVVANLYMSFAALRPTASAGGALARLFVGQFVKVGLTVALFVIVARTGAAAWPPLIAAYIATVVSFWAVPMMASRQPRRAGP